MLDISLLPEEVTPAIGTNKPEFIIIHHSGTDQGDATTFRKYHIEKRKFVDIGYNYVINNGTYKPDGLIEKGRDEHIQGAHCIGYNNKSIGICLVGNFNNYTPTTKQMESLLLLCKNIMERYNIPPEKVLGHNETGNRTDCPGKFFDMDELRKKLKGELITFCQPVQLINNTVYVPLRDFVHMLNGKTIWKGKENPVEVFIGNSKYLFKLNSNEVLKYDV